MSESNEQSGVRRPDAHEAVIDLLLDKVREDRYPSNQQLDLLEHNATGRQRQELVDILADKVAQDRYPSLLMIRRMLRIAETC